MAEKLIVVVPVAVVVAAVAASLPLIRLVVFARLSLHCSLALTLTLPPHDANVLQIPCHHQHQPLSYQQHHNPHSPPCRYFHPHRCPCHRLGVRCACPWLWSTCRQIWSTRSPNVSPTAVAVEVLPLPLVAVVVVAIVVVVIVAVVVVASVVAIVVVVVPVAVVVVAVAAAQPLLLVVVACSVHEAFPVTLDIDNW